MTKKDQQLSDVNMQRIRELSAKMDTMIPLLEDIATVAGKEVEYAAESGSCVGYGLYNVKG